MIPHQDTHTF